MMGSKKGGNGCTVVRGCQQSKTSGYQTLLEGEQEALQDDNKRKSDVLGRLSGQRKYKYGNGVNPKSSMVRV